MELLWENRSLLSSGVTTQAMMFVIINMIYGKRERPWVFALTNALHFILTNVVLDLFLKEKYGDEFWFMIFLPLAGNLLAYVVVVIQAINWRENFVKLLLAFMLADALCGMTGYMMYTIFGTPELIFVLGMLVLAVFCLLFSGLMKKYRNIRLYHPWLVGGFILYTTVQGAFSRVLYILQDANVISAAMFFIGICNIIFAIAFVLVEYIIYTLILQRKYHMLLRNKDQMESYYRQVARHIREIDETRILLEQGTKLLSGADAASGVPQPFGVSKASGAGVPGRQMEREEQEAVAAAPDDRAAMNPRQLQAYLAKLKSQYEALGEVFFCNDFAVDSVLRDYVVRCRKEGIKTDILFHEYQRGKIAAEDAAAILSRMLDYGIKAAKLPEDWKIQTAERHTVLQDKMAQTLISLHGASVKNQLIFSMTVTREGDRDADKNLLKIRIRKRSFNPWMRKYNGIVHVQREETRLQMVVGLENGGRPDK